MATLTLPGISGALFPEWYLRDVLSHTSGPEKTLGALESTLDPASTHARIPRHLRRWWSRVESMCGPASGMRAVFDVAAMPLFGLLGYQARDAQFERGHARATLRTRDGDAVALLLLPWATRPSASWRDVWSAAREAGVGWCFVFAPPYLSLVDTRGQVTRRSVDFEWPDVLHDRSLRVFATLTDATAFEHHGGARRIDALLEAARRGQDRVRDDLRLGVVRALQALSDVIEAPGAAARVHQALTLVYRILFLKFAESRGLLPLQDAIYGESYAMAALSRQTRQGEDAPGVWDGVAATTRLSRQGCRTDWLVVAPFNGHLFARSAAPSLERHRGARPDAASAKRDGAMRTALLSLGTRMASGGREELSFRDLGVEELGSVYERVLDLDAEALVLAQSAGGDGRTRTTPVERAHSHLRKQTGTFYTPKALAEFVVRRALAPLVAGRSAEAILALRVVDPAMGSGAFLVSACRYLAGAYEQALIDEGRASPIDFDEQARANIRRLIAERCLAGVDINPLAVQLARLSLWLTTLARGKPLGFLDHRLRVGNSLVGASMPDLSRPPGRRRTSPPITLPLFDADELAGATRRIRNSLIALQVRPDDAVSDVRAKERIWTQLNAEHSPLHRWRLAASVWCAQWFWPDGVDGPPSPAEIRALLDAILRGDRTLPAARLARRLDEASAAATTHGFFHWPFEFSDVFADEQGSSRTDAGFDAVIGNPPWEMLRRDADAADEPALALDHRKLLRFVRDSGVYEDSGVGHLNLYQPFVERALALCRHGGQIGLVLPWSVAVDDGSARLRERLFDRCRIGTLVGLENSEGMFPIHRGLRFLALAASPGPSTLGVRAHFAIHSTKQIDELPDDAVVLDGQDGGVRLSSAQVKRIGGSSRRIPYVRDAADLAIADRLAARFPPFGSSEGWHGTFGRELNATEDKSAFGDQGLPVIDGKHIEPFRTRETSAGTFISPEAARRRLPDRRFERRRLAYRDVSGYGNRRTLIAALVPPNVVTTHTLFCLRGDHAEEALHFLCGVFNSYVLNAHVRALMGSHLTTSLVEHLPVPPAGDDPRQRRIARLAEGLSRRASPRLEAALQAEVALLYSLDLQEFVTVLNGLTLVGVQERARAVRQFEKRAER